MKPPSLRSGCATAQIARHCVNGLAAHRPHGAPLRLRLGAAHGAGGRAAPPGLEERLADIHSLHPRARRSPACSCGAARRTSSRSGCRAGRGGKRRFFAQVEGLRAYRAGSTATPGARRLLARSRVGVNPMDRWLPSVPRARHVARSAERRVLRVRGGGARRGGGLAFVLPAGGLGERLGFDGVKLALPSEIASGASVLAVYAGHILALQRLVAARLGRAVRMPFVIMTSQDTHAGTAGLFAEHGHFGLEPSQVTLLLQQRVAALVDDDARFARGKCELLTKPHGHGDVHVLLHRAGLAARWLKEGRKWVMFFKTQHALLLDLPRHPRRVARRQLDLNLRAPRRDGARSPRDDDARRQRRRHARRAGRVQPAAAALKRRAASTPRATPTAPTATRPSPATRTRSSPRCRCTSPSSRGRAGWCPFVNPKYKKGDGAGFQSPTRLECMMQDYARLLDEDAAVGFTSHPIEYGYFPCKNNLADAQALSAKGVPSYGAASSEMAVYAAHAAALRRLGAAVPLGVERSFHGVAVTQGPAVVFAPSFAPTMSELRRRFPTASAVLTARSTLLVDGEDVTIDALASTARSRCACATAPPPHHLARRHQRRLELRRLSEAVLANDECPPLLRMRGYTLRKKQRLIAIKGPGATRSSTAT